MSGFEPNWSADCLLSRLPFLLVFLSQFPDAGMVVVGEHKSGICAYAYASFEWRSEFGGETMHCVDQRYRRHRTTVVGARSSQMPSVCSFLSGPHDTSRKSEEFIHRPLIVGIGPILRGLPRGVILRLWEMRHSEGRSDHVSNSDGVRPGRSHGASRDACHDRYSCDRRELITRLVVAPWSCPGRRPARSP